MVFVSRNFFWLCKNLCSFKNFLDQGKHFYGKLLWKFLWSSKFFSWKISMTVENFIVCGKFIWSSKIFLYKISTTLERFLGCGKVPYLWNSSLTVEKSLHYGKVLSLWKTYFLDCRKIICLIILNANANVETTKTLNLEQKLSSFAFFCGT